MIRGRAAPSGDIHPLSCALSIPARGPLDDHGLQWSIVMCAVEFPSMRENLIVALDFLANSGNVQRIYEEKDGKILAYYDFDMAVHQLFDDAECDFTKSPEESIGFTVRNNQEAGAVNLDVTRLEVVLSEDNPKDIDAAFAGTKRWKAVIDAAKAALIEFERS